MAIKATAEITLSDYTDAYSVTLTSYSHTFNGNTTGAPSGLSCTTQVIAHCGTNPCSNITVGTITCPTGISATISNNKTSSPTITFTTTATISSSCEATIPVTVGDDTISPAVLGAAVLGRMVLGESNVVINKKFSFAVAKTGVSVKSVTRYYCLVSDIPPKPTTKPPGSTWTTTEPEYVSGKTGSLYFVDCTVFTDGTYEYSEVSKSSTYDAINGFQVGARNLIRNSINLIFKDYLFK